MRFFYDTEFIEDGTTIDLVSIGIVGEDGREFYAVSTEFDPDRAGKWVRANVLPKLPPPSDRAWMSRARMREEILDFCTGAPGDVELWAWIAAYDHVALCQLWEDAGRPALPQPPAEAHDALADARHNLRRWEVIAETLATGAAPR